MSKKQSFTEWQISGPVDSCICSQLRRTARRVSSLYDKVLAAAGLTVTQHALMINIARAGEIGRTTLAAQLGMDRTTLTRNLKPLENAGFVVPAKSLDRRERLLCLSADGNRRLRQSYQNWEKVQKEFASRIGTSALATLREALEAADLAADVSFTDD